MQRLFKEFSITKQSLQSKSNKQHWKLTSIKSDVHQFKVIIFHHSPIKFSLQKETNGGNQKTVLLVTAKFSYREKNFFVASNF